MIETICNQKYVFAPYNNGHKQGVIELLAYMWKECDREKVEARFNWRYFQNPHFTKPLVFVCLIDDVVVAVRAFVVIQYYVGNQLVNVCSPADAIVHPSYRRLGLFSRLTIYALKYLENLEGSSRISFYLNLSSNLKSTPGNLKLGWISLSPKNYYTNISIIVALKTALKSRQNKFISQPIMYNNRLILVSDKIQIDEITSINQSYRTAITANHNKEYYQWRYTNSSSVVYIYTYLNESMDSYIILRSVNNYVYSIEEFGYRDPESLLICFKVLRKKLSFPILRLFFISSQENDLKILKKGGFIRDPKLLLKLLKKKRTPVLIRPRLELYQPEDFLVNGIDIRNIKLWRLFKADVH